MKLDRIIIPNRTVVFTDFDCWPLILDDLKTVIITQPYIKPSTKDSKLLKHMYPTENPNGTESPTGIQAELDIRVGDVNTAANGTIEQVSHENNTDITR